MTSHRSGETTLLDYCLSLIVQNALSLSADVHSSLRQTASDYLHQKINYNQAATTFTSIVGSTDSIDHLREIIQIPQIPFQNDPANVNDLPNRRHKMKMWTHEEDNRLLAGIYRHGLNNWAPISRFVGNSRTRAQCAQRWTRGLNPKICKETWDQTEDAKLAHLVVLYGEKSWMRIAGMMGNRSDVQCRYRYLQLTKEIRTSKPVKPVFPDRSIVRFSMPNITPLFDGMERQPNWTRKGSIIPLPISVPLTPMVEPKKGDSPNKHRLPDCATIEYFLNPVCD
jgi:hypothetical protein